MGKLLIEIAYDENKNIVFVNNAVKGKMYFCPKCGEELIFKNSGKTGQGSRCPHFAHKGCGGHNCDPESVLHAAFKKETAKILSSHLKESTGFNIKWRCSDCGSQYSGDLLFLAKTIEVEYDLKVCRPDIALLDDAGKVRIAIEIVNTHAPEEKVEKYYNDNGIVLVQYNVHEDDLLNIEEKLLKPDIVSLCLNSACKTFVASLLSRRIDTEKATCKRCGKQVDVFYAEYQSPLGHILYYGINNNDLLVLEKKGIASNMLMKATFTKNNISIDTIATKCPCVKNVYYTFSRSPRRRRRYPSF